MKHLSVAFLGREGGRHRGSSGCGRVDKGRVCTRRASLQQGEPPEKADQIRHG